MSTEDQAQGNEYDFVLFDLIIHDGINLPWASAWGPPEWLSLSQELKLVC